MEMYEVKILQKYRTSLERQIGETIHIRGTEGTVLNDRDEFNRCELPVLSVSRQTNKTTTNSKDREIMQETDKLQEIRPEVQFKRQQRTEEETGIEIETVRKGPMSKRQRRHAVPKRTAWSKRDPTEMARDIRLRETGDSSVGEIETNSNKDEGDKPETELSRTKTGEKEEKTPSVAESETDETVIKRDGEDMTEIRDKTEDRPESESKFEESPLKEKVSRQVTGKETDIETKDMDLRDKTETEMSNKIRDKTDNDKMKDNVSNKMPEGGTDEEKRDREKIEDKIEINNRDKIRKETDTDKIRDKTNAKLEKECKMGDCSVMEKSLIQKSEKCHMSSQVECRMSSQPNCENIPTNNHRGVRRRAGSCEMENACQGWNVEENSKIGGSDQKTEVTGNKNRVHPFVKKSDIGSANPSTLKKPTSANLRSSFKPRKPRKILKIQSNSILDYFVKKESATNLDLLRQSDPDQCIMTDSNIVDHQ